MVKKSDKLSLRDLKPLVFYICWGYVGLNALLAAGLFHQHVTGYLTVTQLTPPIMWSAAFLILSVTGAYSLMIDHWWLVKRTLEAALFIKFLWFLAIVGHTLSYGGVTLLAMWSFLAYIQFLTIVFFPDRK